MAGLPRKNCWTIAEHAGESNPDGMQHLLARAVWDTDGVRDDVRDDVVEYLGDLGAVLVVDETGDVKKGSSTVGTQRQYTGTAGRVENAQVAVYLTYAGQAGHAMIDRELYLPRSWTSDPERCAAAEVPTEVEFATKPELAWAMLSRALKAAVPARWVAADEVYLPIGEPPRQPGRSHRAQPRHRGEHLPGQIGAPTVQADEEALPGQLRRRQPDQQLPAGEPATTGLDRPDRRINNLIMFRRSTNSVTATIPDTGVNDGSGAPTRTHRRNRAISRALPT